MTHESSSSITPNPLIEQMLRASSEGEEIVELRGYVGPSTPDTVRLYEKLSMARYFEIPRSAIVCASYEGDPTTSPVRLHIRGSATIVWARSLTAGTASRTHRLEGFPPKFRAGFVTGHIECEEDSDGNVTCNYVTDLPE